MKDDDRMNREAERLDAEIDALLGGAGVDAAPGSLVAEASRLAAAVAAIAPSPARDDARRRMLTEWSRPRRRRARWIVALPAAAVLGLSSVAVASRGALPGDALFRVERGLQASRIGVTFGSVAKAEAKLDRARADLEAARSLERQDRHDRARDALRLFDGDLAAARAAIAGLEPNTAALLGAEADELENQARILALSLESGDDVSGGATDDDPSGHGRGGDTETEDRSGPDDGEDPSGDDEVEGPDGGDSSGSGSSGSGSSGSGEAEKEAEPSSSPDPEPSPESSNSGSGSGSSGSDSADHPETPSPSPSVDD